MIWGSYRRIVGALVWAVALFGAYHAATEALLANLRLLSPATALAWRADDAGALVKLIDRRLGRQPTSPISSSEVERLHAGLLSSALDRTALRILGIEAANRRNMARADRAMQLSESLSRRDAATQLWLIERAVAKANVPEALTHYNRALLVHPSLQPMLLPILADALTESDVRLALAPYVQQQRPWAIEMLRVGVERSGPLEMAALLMPIAPHVRARYFEAIHARLLSRLVMQGEVALALRYLRQIWPDIANRVASFPVSAATVDPRLGPFAWGLMNADRISVVANEVGGLDATTDALASGKLASRVIPVRGGTSYVFGQTVKSSSQNVVADLSWTASCLLTPQKAPFWEQRLAAQSSDAFEWRVDVPQSCHAMLLELSTRGSDGSTSATITVENLRLTPKLN